MRSHDSAVAFLLTPTSLTHGRKSIVPMEKKRRKPPAPVDTLQEGPTVAKQAKLVLKPPKFITEKQKQNDPQTISSVLEAVMELETAEDVLEHLLGLLDSYKLQVLLEQQQNWPQEEVGRCIASIGKLAKTYREDVCVCRILVCVVELFGMRLRSSSKGVLPKNFQLFVLSLVDHGE